MKEQADRSNLPTVTSPPVSPLPDPAPIEGEASPHAHSTFAHTPGTSNNSQGGSNVTISSPTDNGFSPQAFGRYQLRAILGEGGFGVVFKAFDPDLRRSVALKQIHPSIFVRSSDIERFRQEAQAAAQFDHRHIVSVHEVGEIDGRHYFTMTLASGGALSNYIERYRGKPFRAAELVVKLARAVHYAHCKGVIHRDLKPRNILIDEHGEPRVTDFGLACFVNDQSVWSEEGLKVGTPGYMSPEQARGAAGEITAKTDIWALGVILYEILTGKRPFSAPNRVGLTERICNSDPPSMVEFSPGIPKSIEGIVRKCLAKDPADRFATAAELADTLEKWLASEPWLSRASRTWSRRPWQSLTFSVVLASVLTTTVLYVAGVLREPSGQTGRADEVRWPTAEDGIRVSNWAAQTPLTLVGDAGAPKEYWKYLTEATGRPPLRVAAGDKLRLFTANRILLELVPVAPSAGFTLTAKVQHLGGNDSSCGIYFGHRAIPRGNRTEHWYWAFRFAEVGRNQGNAYLTAWYYHEPLFQPTRVNQNMMEWQVAVNATSNPSRAHDLALSVAPDGISVSFDGQRLWTKTHAELVAGGVPHQMAAPQVINALQPPFPTAEQSPALNGWGGVGLSVETGEASFSNVVISPTPKQ